MVVVFAAGLTALGLSRRRERFPRLDPSTLRVPTAVAPWLEPNGDRATYGVAWWGGTLLPRPWDRVVDGVVELEGQPHLRLRYYASSRHKRLIMSEYFRAEGEAWVCARRQIGPDALALEPPLPVFQPPLEPGASWAWSGRVGGEPAQAEFWVLPSEDPDKLVIRQRTRLASGHESDTTRTYARGHGLLSEDGSFPYDDRGDTAKVGLMAQPSPSATPGASR